MVTALGGTEWGILSVIEPDCMDKAGGWAASKLFVL